MSLSDIIEEALHLPPRKRDIIIASLVKRLNKQDKEIDKTWIAENKKRLKAYLEGTAKTVSYEQVFGK